MAFKQIFESPAIPYTLWDGVTTATYNSYLVVPPRLYMEEMLQPFALFSKRDATATSESTISLIGDTNKITYPSYDMLLWKLDGATGAVISRTPMQALGDIYSGMLYIQSITQAFDGSLWASKVTGVIEEYDPDTFALRQSFNAAHFGRTGTAIPLVDKAADVVMMPLESGVAGLTVYTLSTGAAVRTIRLSGAPSDICAEDGTRAYVLCSNGILNLVNYATGEVISAYRCPVTQSAIYTKLTWDRLLRRLLIYSQVPNASDGSSQNVVRGFYPVPLATHLTTPIPLVAPRRGRQIPVLLRAVGDTGEPIAGVTSQLSVTGGAILQSAPQGTDSNGESLARLLCVSPGSTTLTASASIDD